MLTLLLRPRIQALKNRWKQGVKSDHERGRDLFLIVFGLVMLIGIYLATRWVLAKVGENPHLSYLPPGQFLGLIFVLLFLMLFISNVLATLGSFYFSDDLDLIRASPIPEPSFFAGKLCDAWTFTSWMPFTFILPLLAAFGQAYHASPWYYLIAPLGLVAYFLIPCALAVTVATLVLLLIPAHRVRELVVFVLISAIASLFVIIRNLHLDWTTLRSAQEILRIISILSMPHATWLPSNWLAMLLEQWLTPQGRAGSLELVLLWLCALCLSAFGFMVVQVFYEEAYARARSRLRGKRRSSPFLRRLSIALSRFLRPHVRALISKEFRLVSRDVGQAVQLLMLVALALLYLYHLRVFSAVDSFPESIRPWWRNFLFIGNVVMGAFVTTAICTRFVYPSLSLEGRSYWILQASPLHAREVVRAKFWCWFFPIALISAIFFACGASVVGAGNKVVLLSVLLSVMVCYGVIGFAIGLGALFSHFDWEHASQLIGGFGSLIYMLAATFLILLNTFPAYYLLKTELQRSSGAGITALLSVFVVVLLNVLAAEMIMRRGTEELIRKMA